MGVLLSLSGLLGSGMSKSEQISIIKSTILLKFLKPYDLCTNSVEHQLIY